MKKLFFLGFIAATVFAFTACDKDSNGDSSDEIKGNLEESKDGLSLKLSLSYGEYSYEDVAQFEVVTNQRTNLTDTICTSYISKQTFSTAQEAQNYRNYLIKNLKLKESSIKIDGKTVTYNDEDNIGCPKKEIKEMMKSIYNEAKNKEFWNKANDSDPYNQNGGNGQNTNSRVSFSSSDFEAELSYTAGYTTLTHLASFEIDSESATDTICSSYIITQQFINAESANAFYQTYSQEYSEETVTIDGVNVTYTQNSFVGESKEYVMIYMKSIYEMQSNPSHYYQGETNGDFF